ncbi:hypothetical protein BG011_004439 [Mortierella polycephala]|uniref:F-box domain-containing protein n=1 Tax=Mortierella polycephala TaxID=41804 RepID=A0A9P6U2B4_9FUNG|nr:hypothetical protein BG011_004439 [Mortierella polycephala]
MVGKSKANPLRNRAILTRIGQRLPLWESHIEGSISTFKWKPKDLIASSSVCRAWRKAMLPVLFHTFDARCMTNIPVKVLQRMSGHFRILDLTYELDKYSLIAPVLRFNRLERFRTFWSPELVRMVVEHSPGLKAIYLQGECRMELRSQPSGLQLGMLTAVTPLKDAEDVLKKLRNLHELSLVHVISDGDCLYRILRNKPSLRALSFWNCAGSTIPPIGVPNLPVQELSVADIGSAPFPFALLMSVMPHLKIVTSLVNRENHHAIEENLVLKDNCHEIKTLNLVAPFTDGTPWVAEMIRDAHSSLEDIILRTKCISPKILDALIVHSSRLVNLTIISSAESPDDPAAYFTILTSCSKLEMLRGRISLQSKTVSETIFSAPWVCTELKTFEFQGLHEFDPNEGFDFLQLNSFMDVLPPVRVHAIPDRWELSEAKRIFIHEGVCTPTFSEERRSKRQTFEFHQQLLQHLEPMKKLKEVIVNDSRYTPASRT